VSGNLSATVVATVLMDSICRLQTQVLVQLQLLIW
jgi:hypothetical protein